MAFLNKWIKKRDKKRLDQMEEKSVKTDDLKVDKKETDKKKNSVIKLYASNLSVLSPPSRTKNLA